MHSKSPHLVALLDEGLRQMHTSLGHVPETVLVLSPSFLAPEEAAPLLSAFPAIRLASLRVSAETAAAHGDRCLSLTDPSLSCEAVVSLLTHPWHQMRALSRLANGGQATPCAVFGDTGWSIAPLGMQLTMAQSAFEPPFSPVSPQQEQAIRDLVRQKPVAQKPAIIPGRVLMTIGSLGPGGAERQLVATIKGLRRRGIVDIHLLCQALDEEGEDFYWPQLAKLGIVPRAMPMWCQMESGWLTATTARLSPFLSLLPWPNREFILSYLWELIRTSPQVLHIWMDMPELIFAGILAGVPRIVVSWQSLSPTHFSFYHPTMKLFYQAVGCHPRVAFTNNSRCGAADYAAWLGIPPNAVRVLYNGLDADLWKRHTPGEIAAAKSRLGIPETALVVGGLLRFDQAKNPALWLRTAARILQGRPDVHCVLFGGGPLENELRDLAAALCPAGRIHFPGVTDQAALALCLCDVVLLTSRVEGIPNVLLEAQLLGIPVVASAVGGVSEAMEAGVTGIPVAGDREEDFANAVDRVLMDPALRENAQSVSRTFIKKLFGLERMIDDTLVIYQQSPPVAIMRD